MPPCFSRGIPAAECCRWVPTPSRCAGCDMPGGLRAGSPVRQGTCSGVCYAKKTYICTNTNITTMKVLLINGSPHREGNTFIALSEVARTLEAEGIGAEIVHIGTRAMQGCIACGKCAELGHCVFSDAVYTAVREKLAQADGLVVGSPVYYAGPNGSLCALLDRVFYSCGRDLAYKPAAAVAVCRRGGASATFDRLNKYFTISNMPVVSSQYWNSVHGRVPREAHEDAEGLQTMRVLARNMAQLLKAGVGPRLAPEPEERVWTHFIR